MKRVIIESPFAGNVARNVRYTRACMLHSLQRGETPLASHLLYTQSGILDDDKPNERLWGIEAGFNWGKKADLIAVYQDFGLSKGMKNGISFYEQLGKPIEYRNLSKEELEKIDDLEKFSTIDKSKLAAKVHFIKETADDMVNWHWRDPYAGEHALSFLEDLGSEVKEAAKELESLINQKNRGTDGVSF